MRPRDARFLLLVAFLPAVSLPGASADEKAIPNVAVNRHTIDLDADGTEELEWVETIEWNPQSPAPNGLNWTRTVTLVPKEGVQIRTETNGVTSFPVLWTNPANPPGDFPGEDAHWTSLPAFVCSVTSANFSPPPFGPPVTVVFGTIAGRAPAREEPHHLRVRVGTGEQAREGWMAIRFRDLGGGLTQASPGDLEVSLRGFGLGQPGEPPRIGVGDRFRPVRFRRTPEGLRIVFDTLALRNGVESTPSLSSPAWSAAPGSGETEPVDVSRFYRFRP